ncbi:MAG: hypothetical protein GH152_04560 [Dehalococcoidia bacterium]|nr:hypothetical protein [Dehalococcoidia bacterium]
MKNDIKPLHLTNILIRACQLYSPILPSRSRDAPMRAIVAMPFCFVNTPE